MKGRREKRSHAEILVLKLIQECLRKLKTGLPGEQCALLCTGFSILASMKTGSVHLRQSQDAGLGTRVC